MDSPSSNLVRATGFEPVRAYAPRPLKPRRLPKFRHARIVGGRGIEPLCGLPAVRSERTLSAKFQHPPEVRGAGVEPARAFAPRFLRPGCLPIPSSPAVDPIGVEPMFAASRAAVLTNWTKGRRLSGQGTILQPRGPGPRALPFVLPDIVSVGRAVFGTATCRLKVGCSPSELTTRAGVVVGRERLELSTSGLRGPCSAVELATQDGFRAAQKPLRLESRTLLAGWKKPHQKPHLSVRPMMLAPSCEARGDRRGSNPRHRGHSPVLYR